jgi:magnesium transporter
LDPSPSVGLWVGFSILALAHWIAVDRPLRLALTAALTLLAVAMPAALVGSVVPVVLQRLGFDPAVATGVFITTSNDVMGVRIFFLIATAIDL